MWLFSNIAQRANKILFVYNLVCKFDKEKPINLHKKLINKNSFDRSLLQDAKGLWEKIPSRAMQNTKRKGKKKHLARIKFMRLSEGMRRNRISEQKIYKN